MFMICSIFLRDPLLLASVFLVYCSSVLGAAIYIKMV